jgi:signal transduction histidine kinase
MTSTSVGHCWAIHEDRQQLVGGTAADEQAQGAAGGLAPEALNRLASLGLSAACLAHDMGNLLQVVASAVCLIERDLKTTNIDGIRKRCMSAREAVDRIVALRNQILDLARVQPTVLQRVDVTAVLPGLRGLIDLTLGRDICFEMRCEDDVPAITCDAQELENALFNLVLNARDAMPSGGRLTVALSRGAGGWADPRVVVTQASRVVIRVTDTGCGMSPAVLSRVFTPFYSTKGAGRGTGLGLPMVSEFALRAGGSVEIESKLGVGTAVTLSLPAANSPNVG